MICTYTLRWINPLLWRGFRRDLKLKDVYKCPSSQEAARLAKSLNE